MPGISFLNNKTWHPSNKANQRRIWVAEQQHEEKLKRDAETNAQLKRELDMYNYEQMAKGKGGSQMASEMNRGPSDIAFLYAKPPGTEMLADAGNPKDDEAVREFFLKAQQAKKRRVEFSAEATVTALEKATGKRKRDEATVDEMVERFPFLKNAPMEGDYAKDLKVTFKPFNQEVKQVRCMRCGNWGHKSGDRECPLVDFNPHDAARQKREDPLTYMRNDLVLEKEKLVLKLGALPREMALSAADRNSQVVLDDDEDGGGGIDDVDEEFLSKLSTKEKKLLLQRLKDMGNGQDGEGEGSSSRKQRKKEKKRQRKEEKKAKKRAKHAKKEKKRRKDKSDSSSSSSSDSD